LTTDVDFNVGPAQAIDVIVGCNWLSLWQHVGALNDHEQLQQSHHTESDASDAQHASVQRGSMAIEPALAGSTSVQDAVQSVRSYSNQLVSDIVNCDVSRGVHVSMFTTNINILHEYLELHGICSTGWDWQQCQVALFCHLLRGACISEVMDPQSAQAGQASACAEISKGFLKETQLGLHFSKIQGNHNWTMNKLKQPATTVWLQPMSVQFGCQSFCGLATGTLKH
jgi:hypothetical protein